MAPHIALHEIGVGFEPRWLSFAKKEQQAPAYLAINPEGKVPTARDQILTGNCRDPLTVRSEEPGAKPAPSRSTIPLLLESLTRTWFTKSVGCEGCV